MTVTNPIKKIREDHNLTVADFASLAGCSTQVVMRSEAAMYPSLNPTVIKTCLALEPSLTENDLLAEYDWYIKEELRKVKLPDYIDGLDDRNLKSYLDARTNMLAFRTALTYVNNMPDSNYSLCKLLKVHTYPIERFLKGRKDTAPIHIYERIRQIRDLKQE